MASTLCMRTTVSPEQWQLWTAGLPLLGLTSLAEPMGQLAGDSWRIKDQFTAEASASAALSASFTINKW